MEETKNEQTTAVLEEPAKKKSLKEFIESHPKSVFWIRFVIWALFAAVLPFLFIAFRYGIFDKLSSISISGWGLVAIIIVMCFAFYLVRCLRMGLKGRSPFVLQCVNGVCKVIVPLVCALFLLDSIKNSIAVFEQALIVVTLCEAIAIPINPMPVWVHEMNEGKKEEDRKDAIGYLWSEYFSRKKHEGE